MIKPSTEAVELPVFPGHTVDTVIDSNDLITGIGIRTKTS